MPVPLSFLEKAQALFGEAQKVVLLNHANPDGDAVGSAVALCRLLRQAGKEALIVMPNPFAPNLRPFAAYAPHLIYDSNPAKAEAQISAADLLIHLDYNAPARSGPVRQAIEAFAGPQMVIDHHQQPEYFADALFSDPRMSSTCEMVYHLAMALRWEAYFDRPTAEALYCGLSTDTGNFRFSSVTPATLRAAAHLLEWGINIGQISSQLYESNRPERLKLLSRMLAHMEIHLPWRTVLLWLSQADLEELHFVKGDTEGFVNYGLSMAEMELSILVYPREGTTKMSFRSKTDFDVNRFAREHFQGGGHKNAAGAQSDLGLEETLHQLRTILPQYAEELQAYGAQKV